MCDCRGVATSPRRDDALPGAARLPEDPRPARLPLVHTGDLFLLLCSRTCHFRSLGLFLFLFFFFIIIIIVVVVVVIIIISWL